jgi:hypothetical protein
MRKRRARCEGTFRRLVPTKTMISMEIYAV